MTKAQIDKLIKALEIRKEQLYADINGKKLKYKLHDGHHTRDVLTVLAILNGDKDANKLLANMPTEEDRPEYFTYAKNKRG